MTDLDFLPGLSKKRSDESQDDKVKTLKEIGGPADVYDLHQGGSFWNFQKRIPRVRPLGRGGMLGVDGSTW